MFHQKFKHICSFTIPTQFEYLTTYFSTDLRNLVFFLIRSKANRIRIPATNQPFRRLLDLDPQALSPFRKTKPHRVPMPGPKFIRFGLINIGQRGQCVCPSINNSQSQWMFQFVLLTKYYARPVAAGQPFKPFGITNSSIGKNCDLNKFDRMVYLETSKLFYNNLKNWKFVIRNSGIHSQNPKAPIESKTFC